MNPTHQDQDRRDGDYEPPTLTALGSLYELTLGCSKNHGGSDGFAFRDDHIVCTSP